MPSSELYLLTHNSQIQVEEVSLPGDERTSTGHHNVLFAVNVLLLKSVDNVLFLEALEGECERPVVDTLNEFDTTETTDT